MLDKIINIVDKKLDELNNQTFKNIEELEYLNSIKLDIYAICEYDFFEIYKLSYYILSNGQYRKITNLIEPLKNYLNRISIEDIKDLDLLLSFFMNDKFSNNDELLIGNRNGIKKFPRAIRKFLTDIFTNEKTKKIDGNAYNLFIKLLSTEDLSTMFAYAVNLLAVKLLVPSRQFFKEVKYRPAIKNIDKDAAPLQMGIDCIIEERHELLDEYKKFNKNKNKQIYNLQLIRDAVLNNESIKYDKNVLNDLELDCYIIAYRNKRLNIEYENELNEAKELALNGLSIKEKMLMDYGFNLNPNLIEVDEYILNDKLDLINKHFSKFKEFTNISLLLINRFTIDDLEKLINLLVSGNIDLTFILNNMVTLSEKDKFDNFILNANLISKNNISMKNLIKFDFNILFIDNKILSDLISKYLFYEIDLSSDFYDFTLFTKDYTYIIEKFIEIGEYELIKNNPSLINDKSEIIIKRIVISKLMNNKIVNDSGKLSGKLRREDSFILSDNEVNETVITNDDELIPKDIYKELETKKQVNVRDVYLLNDYSYDKFSYNFNGMIISKRKVLSNYNKLLDKFSNNYPCKDLLFYSIVYKYPKLITKENISNLNIILNNIEKKLIK